MLPDATSPLTAELVRALCDRRAGLGADGVLRVERRRRDPAGVGWFMDYRNADGSVAEMCGNGIRVFARHLVDAGLAEPGPLLIGTRAGVRDGRRAGDRRRHRRHGTCRPRSRRRRRWTACPGPR